MKFYLISDNIDTQMGVRLSGIEGVVVHGPATAAQPMMEVSVGWNILIFALAKTLLVFRC